MTNHKDLRAPSPAGVEVSGLDQCTLRILTSFQPSPFSSRSHTPIPRVTSPAMDGPSRSLTPHERPSRYPSELGARRSAASSGHVPLHRRGTSRTYERLEDLLAEAGYKDTRIFTPDAERVRAGAKAEGESPPASPSPAPHALPAVTKGPVDTVVGFLTGLIPNRVPSPSPDGHDRRNYVSPVRRTQLPSITSPIPGHSKLPHARSALPSAAASPLAQYSRLPPAPSAGPSRAPSYATLPQPHGAGFPNRRAYTTPAYGPSSSSSLLQDDNAPTPTLRPRPSVGGLSYSEAAQARRALSQLRSMASVPNMAQRRRQPANIGTGNAGGPRRAASSRAPLAPVHARDADADADADTALHGAAGPVPASWLEAVARAVLGVAAPAVPRRRRRSPSPDRRHGRGGGRTSGIAGPNSTAVGVSRGRAPAPGTYLARAPSAPGAVSVARVVCQSAPGSRAVSRSRAVGSRGRRSGRRDKAGAPPLPVLARTLVEHDPLWAPLADAPAANAGSGPPSAPAVVMTFASPAPDCGRGADAHPRSPAALHSLAPPTPLTPRGDGRPRGHCAADAASRAVGRERAPSATCRAWTSDQR
jgi:hypothetical protein